MRAFCFFVLFFYVLWPCAVTLPLWPRAGGGLVITDLAECRLMAGDDICVLEPCGTQADFVGQLSSCINFGICLLSQSSPSVSPAF